MARKINIHEAKTHLSRMVEEVEKEGKEIVIARAGQPVARLVPIAGRTQRRKLGLLSGRFTTPTDFDAPLPEQVVREFEGGDDAPVD